MENRYTTNPTDFKNYTTERVRNDFLIESLFVEGEIKMVYTHYDRTVVGGVIPTTNAIKLDAGDFLRTEYFLERREIGIVNIGPKGKVTVEGEVYDLNKRDCLYIGLGKENVTFESEDSSNPAKFYFVSALAHKEYPTKVLPIADAEPERLGEDATSNKRTIYKYIHQNGIQSCQLMMGMTLLEPNNMWNTMPAHIHDRRNEVYLYFDMDEDSRVFHFMGEPTETRHLVVKNEQAIISPPWSIHSGVGTKNYTFIWAMAGENYTFKDMDFVPMENLK
ncbi:5-dehydro-4-deoxy-D-glucuronate isomerase [Alkalihalobacillus trypoxylicola]|uniref:4-deoxy-L-threo-5-hexosulose-uronate ketol-isomerase n=1 Tax=Alkalihalobacillus trypoxylicola TaxID=519424 RepID=A0A161PE78_9BACI|nr:5-dehydro-4-deoxy-D-glucuronate isomerase [Alkalihalobacillus trypoxylicola]KYG26580.1 5-keto-4-deoxyuronate isomerase [Alkalihalobacillus trypoxylicola]GAF64821.1 5-keto-4-deoxyuronate isomerase [Bacillus sp. TS-2]